MTPKLKGICRKPQIFSILYARTTQPLLNSNGGCVCGCGMGVFEHHAMKAVKRSIDSES